MFSDVLAGFSAQLAFGMGLALLTVSPTQVRSGFFRIHLWIMMGLSLLAGLILFPAATTEVRAAAIGAVILSYFAAVGWLYERTVWGWIATTLAILAQFILFARGVRPGSAAAGAAWGTGGVPWEGLASGALLGFTVTAMLLGHWYLNVPGMRLAPLRKLLVGIFVTLAIRAALELGHGLPAGVDAGTWNWEGGSMIGLRWIAGILGTGCLTAMAWQTLKIPNTQSATGILYVAVILVFLGELSARLLWS